MWPRLTELVLGVWLLASPFVLGHPPEYRSWWASDLVGGGLLVVLALAGLGGVRQARFGEILIGLWLVGFGRLASSHPHPAALQNDILVGLTLLMFAILPNEASQPPPSWREHLAAGP